jgi:hypothetical protein
MFLGYRRLLSIRTGKQNAQEVAGSYGDGTKPEQLLEEMKTCQTLRTLAR